MAVSVTVSQVWGSLDQRGDDGRVFGTGTGPCVVAGEEGVFAVQRNSVAGVFDGVAGDPDPTISHESSQPVTVFRDVGARLAERDLAETRAR